MSNTPSQLFRIFALQGIQPQALIEGNFEQQEADYVSVGSESGLTAYSYPQPHD